MREYTAECMESTGIKPTFSDLFIRACALSFAKNPLLNAYFMDDHVLVKGEVNIGLLRFHWERRGLSFPTSKTRICCRSRKLQGSVTTLWRVPGRES